MPITQLKFIGALLCLILLFNSGLALAEPEKAVFCKRIAEAHRPADDVNYKPGVNSYGKPVAPADLNSALNIKTLYPIRIPIVMDMIERYGLDMPDGVMGESYIAEIAVYEDGRTTFNGQDISANIQTYCLDEKASPKPFDTQPKPSVTYDGEALDGEFH